MDGECECDCAATVRSVNFKASDIIVFEVAVGNMPPQRAEEHLAKAKESVKELFPKGQKFLFIGSRGETNTKITVLSAEW